MKQESTCMLCGGGPLRRQRAYRPRQGIFSESSLAQCAACGLVQIVPLPTDDALDEFYRTAYRTEAVERFPSPYDDPVDINFRTLSQVEFIRRHAPAQTNTIVDVGCGFGQLLTCLRQPFPQAQLYGVEISAKCEEPLRKAGIQLARTTLEKAGRNPFDRTFDLLTCSHVLEHSSSVPSFLKVCWEMLRPGGVAMFEVPNCEHEYGSDMPHLVFFTPKTLAEALRRSGFEVLFCEGCGPTVERWLPGRRERVRNWIEDHFPRAVSRQIKTLWRVLRSRKAGAEPEVAGARAELAKLQVEAKDEFWHRYGVPGFKHIAIRAAVVRRD